MSVHVVRVERAEPDLEFHSVQAHRGGVSTNTLSRLVGLMNPELGRPMVAINGDFFQMEKEFAGDPRGLQIIDGELISAPSGGVSLCFTDGGQPFITNVWSRFTVTWPNGFLTSLGLNQDRRSNTWAVLYTPAVGYSTRTRGGRELVLEPFGETPWLPLQAGLTYTARIRAIREGGDTCFEGGTMILSLKSDKLSKFPAIAVGEILTISTHTTPDLHGVQTAIGGGPLLVRNSQPVHLPRPLSRPLPSPYSAMVGRNPRSAFGWNEQFFFLVEVDGRQYTLSRGMTTLELARYMIRLGCTDAVNLDGGGSSTLWCNGRIVNSPSDKKERQVANALVLVRRRWTPFDVPNRPGRRHR